jgi:hypothetical protein
MALSYIVDQVEVGTESEHSLFRNPEKIGRRYAVLAAGVLENIMS